MNISKIYDCEFYSLNLHTASTENYYYYFIMACAVKEHITPLLKLPNRIKLKSEMNLMEKVLTKQQ